MNKEEFLECVKTIIYEEGYQCRKGRVFKNSCLFQAKAIHKLAKGLGIELKLSHDDLYNMKF